MASATFSGSIENRGNVAQTLYVQLGASNPSTLENYGTAISSDIVVQPGALVPVTVTKTFPAPGGTNVRLTATLFRRDPLPAQSVAQVGPITATVPANLDIGFTGNLVAAGQELVSRLGI